MFIQISDIFMAYYGLYLAFLTAFVVGTYRSILACAFYSCEMAMKFVWQFVSRQQKLNLAGCQRAVLFLLSLPQFPLETFQLKRSTS